MSQVIADRLAEIKDEIEELAREGLQLIPNGHVDKARSRVYWHNSILSALGTDDYQGNIMHSLQDTVDSMEQDEEWDDE